MFVRVIMSHKRDPGFGILANLQLFDDVISGQNDITGIQDSES